jgi:hypothetical protein
LSKSDQVEKQKAVTDKEVVKSTVEVSDSQSIDREPVVVEKRTSKRHSTKHNVTTITRESSHVEFTFATPARILTELSATSTHIVTQTDMPTASTTGSEFVFSPPHDMSTGGKDELPTTTSTGNLLFKCRTCVSQFADGAKTEVTATAPTNVPTRAPRLMAGRRQRRV